VKRLGLSFSDAAISDMLEQAEWYEQQANSDLSKQWEEAASSTIIRLVQRPYSGAPCRFKSDSLRGLRRVTVAGFSKHLVFYRIENNSVVILRVIHGARDLERLL